MDLIPRLAEFPFIQNKNVLISSSYRRYLEDVRRASRRFFDLGLAVYPNHNQEEIVLDDGFVFMGGEQHKLSRQRIQISFFRAIQRAKLLYVVTSNGYLGQTASIETSYGLAIGTPTFLSEPIKNFGEGVPDVIIKILEMHKIPVLPIEDIEKFGKDKVLKNRHLSKPSPLNGQEKRDLFFSIVSTMRSLR